MERRRARAETRIGAGRHRDANQRQAEHQLVDVLAIDVARAFARRIAYIAEHEQVAERGAREAHHVVRLAGDQSTRETFSVGRGGVCIFDRLFDPLRHLFRNLDAAINREIEIAPGEVGIVDGQRRLDLTHRHRLVENTRQRPVGDRCRILRAFQNAVRFHPQRPGKERRHRKKCGCEQGERYAMGGHFDPSRGR